MEGEDHPPQIRTQMNFEEKPHIAFVYKNFAANPGVSHIGLGVSALNNAKIFHKQGIQASVWPVKYPHEIQTYIDRANMKNPVTHIVIAAPWIPTPTLHQIVHSNLDIKFAVNCHSNVGFLQADTNGVKLLREYIDLQKGSLNFHVAGNSKKFCLWLRQAFATACDYLPNMYYLDDTVDANKPLWNGGVLRIGAFGATRPQKNIASMAGAALAISKELKCDVEFYVSGGRTEGGGNTILNAVRAMLVNEPGITLKELNWASWPQFRSLIRTMHLLLQVSYTESFNMVTADGVAEGVPSVVSDAIDWAPKYWQAFSDDVCDIARVGRQLIFDRSAAKDGLRALEQHNRDSFEIWEEYLGIEKSRYIPASSNNSTSSGLII